MSVYYCPLVQYGDARPAGAISIAGGRCWFEKAQLLERGRAPQIVGATQIPADVLEKMNAARSPIAGVGMDRPRLMGILNATPDSFSDGGEFDTTDTAIAQGQRLISDGADFLDVGGESTRPGALPVPPEQEIGRVEPIIRALVAKEAPISIDTRKASVAQAAVAAGARMINDVSALRYDAQLSDVVVKNQVPVCLMHSISDPETMQDDPEYDDVLLDVYDHLQDRINDAIAAGIPARNIVIDPGIGFGKTVEHNLALMRGLGLFHGLGCPILLGVSRKKFVGRIGHAEDPMDRLPGSVALAIAGFAQGVQITRVHDMAETKQALRLWMAATGKGRIE